MERRGITAIAGPIGVASAISIWQFVEKCGVYKSVYIAQNGLLPLVEREGRIFS
jgi:hypothetical protein